MHVHARIFVSFIPWCKYAETFSILLSESVCCRYYSHCEACTTETHL